MNDKLITVTADAAGIGYMTMNDAAHQNALRPRFVEEMLAAIYEVNTSETIKVLVITGTPEVFCAGADIETLEKLCRKEIKPVDIVLSKALLDIPVPVIAAMEGHAVGGGLAVGLCADMIVMAKESRYGCSFMNMGFTPGMGITKLLEHYMPASLAVEMQYTGTFYRGDYFEGRSAFNYIVTRAGVKNKAQELAATIAEKPRQALCMLKRYQSMQRRKVFEETYTVETMLHEITFNAKEILQQIKENYVR